MDRWAENRKREDGLSESAAQGKKEGGDQAGRTAGETAGVSTEAGIRAAVSHFEVLLREQLLRQQRMEEGEAAVDYSEKARITIGLIDGDGIGPVIMREARRVLEKLLADEISSGRVVLRKIEGLTIENRLALGKAVPDDVLEAIKSCDVLLKGPTTTPKGGSLESANVTLRRELDLFANVRPVTVPEEGIDWIFFRENTEGEYALGSRGVELPGALTMDFKVTTDAGTRRIARAAFEYARRNGKKNVAIVTKANIMKKTDGMFSRIAHEVAADYPEIEAEDWYIDIMTANLVNPRLRSRFQVFLLPNLYGDIITDEAAQIQGGVGTAGSANTGSRYAMFEAIHGSAPRKIEAGEGEYANPSSILKAAEMLLRHIAMTEQADRLHNALEICLETERGVIVTGHRDGARCAEFGDYLLEKL
ncbi:MAG: isocitrate/isopropylmalate dehydrogenase family protein [Oscillospiraceae bacterium]|nr:isocitrate/isopropylmalate dehydrogenase family protein [Oscillospiraceae bacterium]